MNRTRLLRILDRFADTRVLIAGDLMADRYIRGEVHRLSPEAPVPVVRVRHEDHMPGGAGNVAGNIAALGGRPVLLSVVGNDAEGDRLLASLHDRGVDVSGVLRSLSRPTTVKTRVIAGHQQVVRFDQEEAADMSRDESAKLLDPAKERIADCKAVLLSDYGKGVLNRTTLPALLKEAHKRGRLVTVDPKIEHFLRYRGVTCITPNLKEATEGARVLPPKTDADVDALGKTILRRLRCKSVLITRSERGMSLYQIGENPLHVPARALEVFDVTGAGDTVISTLTLALAAGASLADASQLANLAAGVAVAKLGTATVTPDEIRAAMDRWAAGV